MSTIQETWIFPTGQRLEIARGDITRESLDAIVNAANSQLAHGGGVAAAISQAGGQAIQEQSREWIRRFGPVNHEKPAYTGGGALSCRYVIHAVGPVWGSGNEDNKLRAALRGCLELADQLQIASLAVPPISTGIFGFPKDRAAHIFFRTIHDYFMARPDSGVKLVRLTIIDDLTLRVFLDSFSEWAAAQGPTKGQ